MSPLIETDRIRFRQRLFVLESLIAELQGLLDELGGDTAPAPQPRAWAYRQGRSEPRGDLSWT